MSEVLAHLVGFARWENLGPMLQWWAWLALLGLAASPVARRLFPGSLDGGYALGKTLAIALLGWLVWLESSLLGVSITRWSVFAAVAVLALPALALLRRSAAPPEGWWRWVLASEALFALALVGWCLVRSLAPTLASTEKFMDFGFVQAILRSSSAPPPDPWFAGEPVNYYYFGHFVTAVLVRATGVASAVGYNLMVATLFAQVFALAASFAADATLRVARASRAALAGLLSGTLVCLGGNLHPLLYGALGSGRDYAYATATRFVGTQPPTDDRLINEFPAYSFVVADLHAHVLNLPFALALLCVLLHLAARGGKACRERCVWSAREPAAWLVPFLLGLFWMTNSWDAALYTGAAGLVYGVHVLGAHGPRALPRAALRAAAALALAAGVSLPFTLHFEPFGRGVAWADARTPVWQLGVLYGWQLGLAAIWGVTLVARRGRRTAVDGLVALLVLCALLLAAAPEVVYLRDGMTHVYRRANTAFKLGYQAFLLLTLCSGFCAARALGVARAPWQRAALAVCIAALCAPPLLFAGFALRDEARSELRALRPTLDGLSLVRERNPEDAAMARWLTAHAQAGTHLLEAEGRSFSFAGRMSVMTGIPTVLAWTTHEILWRPRADWRQRKRDVARVYAGGDRDETLALLRRYGVRYVVVGEYEQLRYPDLDPAALSGLGETVFRAGASRIVRVSDR